jgi:hypothetical protein
VTVSIQKIVDVQRGTGPGLRKIYITGVNASDGTPEALDHGLPAAPDSVHVEMTSRHAALYEEPTTYLEVEASRTDTQIFVESIGTSSSATACVYLEYTARGLVDGEEDAGEGVL